MVEKIIFDLCPCEDHNTATWRRDSKSPHMAGDKKILVVDDDRDTADLLQLQLRQIGFPLSSVAADGVQAIQMILEEKPDLILLDIILPYVNGLEVARRLKANPRTRSIPILAVTARVMPGSREACLDSGCDGYLAKPYSLQELEAAVRKLLD